MTPSCSWGAMRTSLGEWVGGAPAAGADSPYVPTRRLSRRSATRASRVGQPPWIVVQEAIQPRTL